VPELARGLVAKIDEAYRENGPFQEAFGHSRINRSLGFKVGIQCRVPASFLPFFAKQGLRIFKNPPELVCCGYSPGNTRD